MDSEENIRKRILKYIRNWSSHQGIQDVSAIAVVFAVVLVVEEFISNVNIHEACLRLEELINQFGNRAQNIDKNAQKSIKEKEKQYRISLSKAYDKYKKSSLYNKKSSFHYDQNIKFWDVISAIGHQDSPIKETVSMKHLYILYLSCFKYPISDGDDINRIDKLLTELVWGEMCILENK